MKDEETFEILLAADGAPILDQFSGFVFWNEKDPDYRDAMLRVLQSKR